MREKLNKNIKYTKCPLASNLEGLGTSAEKNHVKYFLIKLSTLILREKRALIFVFMEYYCTFCFFSFDDSKCCKKDASKQFRI